MDADRPGGVIPRTERIRAAGLRVTRPRRLVLQLLEEVGGHLTADEVVAGLHDRGQSLPRGTVFNVVDDLSKRGVIMIADAGPGATLYEASAEWHHHFVCRSCGTVRDVPCVAGRRPCLDAGLASAHVDEAQIIFRGQCDRCAPTVTEPAEYPAGGPH